MPTPRIAVMFAGQKKYGAEHLVNSKNSTQYRMCRRWKDARYSTQPKHEYVICMKNIQLSQSRNVCSTELRPQPRSKEPQK